MLNNKVSHVNSDPTSIVASNYEHVHRNRTPNLHLSMDISANDPTIESYGLSNKGVGIDVL